MPSPQLHELLPIGLPTMVQVYFVTIGGTVFTFFGPVTYVPELGIDAGTIEAFEAGDVIPAALAAQFLSRTADRGPGAGEGVH